MAIDVSENFSQSFQKRKKREKRTPKRRIQKPKRKR